VLEICSHSCTGSGPRSVSSIAGTGEELQSPECLCPNTAERDIACQISYDSSNGEGGIIQDVIF
jgi:hypothetical protein